MGCRPPRQETPVMQILLSFQDGSEAMIAQPTAALVDRLRAILDTAGADPAEFLGQLADELQSILDRSMWRKAPRYAAKPWAFHAYQLPLSAALEVVLTILTHYDAKPTAFCVAVLRAHFKPLWHAPLWRIRLALLKRELAAVRSDIATQLVKPAQNEAA